MKKLSSFFCLLLSMNYLFAQIPNSDMENWTTAPTLIDWETNSNPLTLPPYNPYIVQKDSDAYSGNWAANLYANGVMKPYAKTRFAVPAHPNHLSLYYKLLFAPCVNDSNYVEKDTASVLVELLNHGVVVDSGYWQSTLGKMNYGQLIIPVSQNASIFDSCRITVTGGKIIGGCGIVAAPTQFKVDHFELKYTGQPVCLDSALRCDTCVCPQFVQPVCGCNGVSYINYCYAQSAGLTSWSAGSCGATSVKNLPPSIGEVVLFPVPASNVLNIQYELLGSGQIEIHIFNVLGQTLVNENGATTPGQHETQIALTNFAKGVYLLELRSGKDRVVKKFVVE